MNISILIPTYRCECVSLVESILAQASGVDGLRFEIIVSDDGSAARVGGDVSHVAVGADAWLSPTCSSKRRNDITAPHIINRRIADLPHCRYIEQPENIGRAANRNRLAQEAQYDWLLFIDSHMTVCREDYIRKYVGAHASERAEAVDVFYGGYVPDHHTSSFRRLEASAPNHHHPTPLSGICNPRPQHLLRYRYERRCAAQLSVEARQRNPYRNFHTSNFMVRRAVMVAHPFDERFRHYGYEDVLHGRTLEENGITIRHIDNPLSFGTYESNASFLAKTEESLRTLHTFRDQLRGYSTLLCHADRLKRWHLLPLVRLWHRLFARAERRNLLGNHPSVRLFQLYKLGYYAQQDNERDVG